MRFGGGKYTFQNACRDNHCLITLGFSPLSSFSFLMAFCPFQRLLGWWYILSIFKVIHEITK